MTGVRIAVAVAVLASCPGWAVAEGVRGISPDGEKGWLHTVDPGDTLWDITELYLGSAWIWPSIWRDNDEIPDPHQIEPGQIIWITERGMRMLSAEEAAQIERLGEEGETGGAEGAEDASPAAPERRSSFAPPVDPDDPFAALDRSSADLQTALDFPGLHRFSVVTPEELDGAAAVLGSHDENYWASQGRRTIVSVGEGKVHVGDRFTVFRTRKRLDHPETGYTLGYLVEHLGVADVTEIHTESSFVKVATSYGEISPGDRLMPYEEDESEFRAVRPDPDLAGLVVGVQVYRQYSGAQDVVMIDRGADDGIVEGNVFEVYRGGKEVFDPVEQVHRLVPEDVLGSLMVLKPSRSASLALLLRANRPVRAGDRFRAP